MKSIKTEIDSYLNTVVPKETPEVQIKETRRALYAGADLMFNLLMSLPDELTTEDSIEYMNKFFGEFTAFQQGVLDGKY